jgi:serine phosphatase RsbU (regulator of sigma subunit)
VLYTDGLTEAVDADGEQFGEHGLISMLRERRSEAAQELKESIFNAAAEYCDHAFCDDAALMVVGIE